MQYILSEEELRVLQSHGDQKAKEAEEIINALCTRIANNEPVSVKWVNGGRPTPWKCIHTVADEHYCDNCPVVEICTQPQEFSK